MKYILQDEWCQRGYRSGTVQALVNRRTFELRPINADLAQTLRLCDGLLDLDLPLFPPAIAQIAARAAQEGLVRAALRGERLASQQKYRETEAPPIQTVSWSITGRCNARCRHCYQNAPGRGHVDLSTEEALEVIRELGRCLVTSVSLTGGEPLVRRDLPQLLEAMAAQGMGATALSTNGFLLDEKMAALFEGFGMRPKTQISFDGLGHHDFLRGVSGAEERALRAVDVCVSHGWSTVMCMCLHGGNLESAKETVRLAADRGVGTVRLCPVSKWGGYKGGNGIDLLEFEEAMQAYLDLAVWYFEERPAIKLSLQVGMELDAANPENCFVAPMAHSCLDVPGNRVCESASRYPHISEDGRLLPCVALVESGVEGDFPKVLDKGLVACMETGAYNVLMDICASDILDQNPKCGTCEYLRYCGCGCRAASIAAGNGYRGSDPTLCKFFHGGWHKKFERAIEEGIRM